MLVVELVIAVSVMVLVLWLWYQLYWLPRQRLLGPSGKPAKGKGGSGMPKARSCPLCNTVLEHGELVKSEVFPGGRDRMTHIFGCPHCFPPNAAVKRICPVCLKEVPREGKVIARLFTSPGRKHIHVLGCSSCRNM